MCSLPEWLHEQNKGMAKVTIDDLDIYVTKRYSGMRRNSKAGADTNFLSGQDHPTALVPQEGELDSPLLKVSGARQISRWQCRTRTRAR